MNDDDIRLTPLCTTCLHDPAGTTSGICEFCSVMTQEAQP